MRKDEYINFLIRWRFFIFDNLYGKAMCEKLPANKSEWNKKFNLNENS